VIIHVSDEQPLVLVKICDGGAPCELCTRARWKMSTGGNGRDILDGASLVRQFDWRACSGDNRDR